MPIPASEFPIPLGGFQRRAMTAPYKDAKTSTGAPLYAEGRHALPSASGGKGFETCGMRDRRMFEGGRDA